MAGHQGKGARAVSDRRAIGSAFATSDVTCHWVGTEKASSLRLGDWLEPGGEICVEALAEQDRQHRDVSEDLRVQVLLPADGPFGGGYPSPVRAFSCVEPAYPSFGGALLGERVFLLLFEADSSMVWRRRSSARSTLVKREPSLSSPPSPLLRKAPSLFSAPPVRTRRPGD